MIPYIHQLNKMFFFLEILRMKHQNPDLLINVIFVKKIRIEMQMIAHRDLMPKKMIGILPPRIINEIQIHGIRHQKISNDQIHKIQQKPDAT